MNPLQGLTKYLARLERKLRVLAVTRGAAVLFAAALIVTVVLVVVINQLSFSEPSVFWARILLYFSISAAIAAGLVFPLLRLNRRRAARDAEHKFPQFEQRLLTFTERQRQNAADPFLPLLAADALDVANKTSATEVVETRSIVSFASVGAVAGVVLLWLIISGPGFLGYGTSLLWGAFPKENRKPFYDIRVDPGNRLIRRRSDQSITAHLTGFESPRVSLFARYASSSKWEQAPMQPSPGAGGYEFLFAGVPENVEYYVEAGGVKSGTYKLSVVDLPGVKNIHVTYHFPAWTGLGTQVEDPGGDLRAVQGTVADVEIETDRPLAHGTLLMEDGGKIELKSSASAKLIARVPIEKDGTYHIATLEKTEMVRLSDDYFIEARKVSPPTITVLKPGKDAKVSPIEEVTIALAGKGEFGLQALDLHYSVNGAPEKTVSLLKSKGAKASEESTTLALEDFKLVPGDIVSLYGTARDGRVTTKSDIYFIEAQPFEKEYSQAQSNGGGEGEDQGPKISERQKEIIAATWNQVKGGTGQATPTGENAKFLSGVQSKLKDAAQTLADRMKARQMAGANQAFQAFVENMEKAVASMGPATDQLRATKFQDALPPEQKALQYLLRAESIFRQIQIAFGKGGGSGASGGRDLENMFNLELDTEKNQYESGQQSASEQKQRKIDEALQKLAELARRQQQLADQQRNSQQGLQQRWQQEMLRREAEELKRQMEELTKSDPQQGQESQQGQQSQSSQGQGGQSSQSQSGEQSKQQQKSKSQQSQSKGGQPQSGQQPEVQRSTRNQRQSEGMEEALQRLSEATRDMSGASSAQQPGQKAGQQQGAQGQGETQARRAAERLQEARQLLESMRKQETGNQVSDLAHKAQQLAAQQQDFDNRMRRNFSGVDPGARTAEQSKQLSEQMAQEKQQMLNELSALEKQLQQAARDLASTQREASTKLREGIGQLQQNELQSRMKWTVDFLKRGLGSYAVMREAPVTQGLRDLSDRLRDAQSAMSKGSAGQETGQQALAQAERLRQQVEQMGRGAGQQKGQQAGGQNPGGQQQAGQQPGDRQSGQGGQSPNGSQPGQQAGQSGQPGGSLGTTAIGGRYGGAGNGGWDARNMGDWQSPDPATAMRNYNDLVRDLGRLQQSVHNDPETTKEIQDLMRELQRVDPRKFTENPRLIEDLQTRVLDQVEQIELMLRRKVDGQEGSVRSATPQAVPPGYSNAVAEYFRKLSKAR